MIEKQTQLKKLEIDQLKTSIILFDDKNPNKILGLTLCEWLKLASENFETRVVEFKTGVGEFEQISNNLLNSDITIVLYSCTPLITSKNILFYIDYLVYKELDYLKFPMGCIFKNNTFKNNQPITKPMPFNGQNEEFIVVNSQESFNYVSDMLKNRILDFHINNGVKIVDKNSCIIEPNVKIFSGAEIYPFNLIQGNTIIHENCILKEGNTIIDSEIYNNVAILKSNITNTSIFNDTIIHAFNIITDSLIEKNCVIKSYNNINASKILENTTIESFNKIG